MVTKTLQFVVGLALIVGLPVIGVNLWNVTHPVPSEGVVIPVDCVYGPMLRIGDLNLHDCTIEMRIAIQQAQQAQQAVEIKVGNGVTIVLPSGSFSVQNQP